MNFSTVKTSIFNNHNGVLNSVLSYGLQERIKSNVRLYLYKYNVYDLVEIVFKDYLCVYEFHHTDHTKVEKIRDSLEFYIGYFDSAGLRDKKFLFNLDQMLPVSYTDFEERSSIDLNQQDFAFVLDKNGGYIFGENVVNVFSTTERIKTLDKCLFAFVNELVNVKSPLNNQGITKVGCLTGAIVSGLLNGVDESLLNQELELVDINYKFVNSIKDMDFNSSNILKYKTKLKVDKFNRILKSANNNVVQGEVIEKTKAKGEVNLSDIILVGLDKFAKVIDNNDVIKVNIDCEFNNIRSAYLVKGTMFITPILVYNLSYFIELLNSDNVVIS